MTRTRQWYYDGSAIGGATGKTHTLTSGQTNSDLIECRTEVTYGSDSVAALAEYTGGGLTETFLDAATDLILNSETVDLDFTGTAEGDEIYILVAKAIGTQTAAITGITVEGSPASLVGETSPTVARSKAYVFKIACPAAAANNATTTIGMTGAGYFAPAAWKLSATPSVETITANQYTTNTSPMVGSVNTISPGILLGVGIFEDIVTGLTWTGATEVVEISANGGTKRIEWVSATIDSSETPRTVTAAHTGATAVDHGAIITVALS